MRTKVLFFFSIVLFVATQAFAQSRVEGMVRSPEGAPLPNVTVRVLIPGSQVVPTGVTDENGHYAIDDVKAGSRVLVTASQGGRTIGQAYALVTLKVETVDIQTRPESETAMTAEDLDPLGGLSGEVLGVVRSRQGMPIAAAHVRINETGVSATTDSKGHYSFGQLRAGTPLKLIASATGFADGTSEVVVPSGDSEQVNFALDASPVRHGGNLTVVGKATDSQETGIRPGQVTGIPSLENGDVSRALQLLPGIEGTTESTSTFRVRGGTPDQTLTTYDGYNVYRMPHLFDILGAFNPEALDVVEYSGTDFSAADGGRLSGNVRFTGRSNASKQPSAFVTASVAGTGVVASVPLADRGSVLIAARRSLTGNLFNDILDVTAPRAGQSVRDRVAGFSNGTLQSSPTVSKYSDFNAKLDASVTGKDRVALSVYTGHDAFNNSRNTFLQTDTAISIPPGTPLPSDAVVQVSDAQTWTGRGSSAKWSHEWSQRASTSVTIAHSDFSTGSVYSSRLGSPSSGDLSFLAGRGGSAAQTESNRVKDTTVRIDNSAAKGTRHLLSFGAQITNLDVQYVLSREAFFDPATDTQFTPALFPLFGQDASGNEVAVYAQDAWSYSRRLTIKPGLRIARYGFADATFAEPRLFAEFQLGRGVHINGGWSLDHQGINAITREDLVHGDSQFWALSNGSSIPVARSNQFVLGASVEKGGLLFATRGYYRILHNLTLFAPRLAPGVLPAPDPPTFVHTGSGWASGLEITVQKSFGRNTLWTAYTASSAYYRVPTLQAGNFPSSWDQRSELKLADTARIAGPWSASAAFVVASGRPYTPAQEVTPVTLSSGMPLYEITFGAKNSYRLPAYHRLDLSTQVDLNIRAFKSTLGFAVLNVYKRNNVWLRGYETASDTLTTTDLTMMGRVLNVFLRVGF